MPYRSHGVTKQWRENGAEARQVNRIDKQRRSKSAAPPVSPAVLKKDKRVYMTLEFVKAMPPAMRDRQYRLWKEGIIHIDFDPRFDSF